jgi:hypothetical protein
MLWIISGSLLGVLYGIFVAEVESFVEVVFFAIFFAGFGAMSSGMLSIAYPVEEVVTKTKSTEQIYNLYDNHSTSGNLYLGTGSIEGRKYYYYMTKQRLGHRSKRIPASQTYIKEINPAKTDSFRVEARTKVRKDMWYRLTWSRERFYVVYIPKNSIDRSFNVK